LNCQTIGGHAPQAQGGHMGGFHILQRGAAFREKGAALRALIGGELDRLGAHDCHTVDFDCHTMRAGARQLSSASSHGPGAPHSFLGFSCCLSHRWGLMAASRAIAALLPGKESSSAANWSICPRKSSRTKGSTDPLIVSQRELCFINQGEQPEAYKRCP